ncbi:MAG: hypothetical protein OXC07_05010 [Kistimonas sp.]|nr:hypothetical protein [Kistimonas sp.]
MPVIHLARRNEFQARAGAACYNNQNTADEGRCAVAGPAVMVLDSDANKECHSCLNSASSLLATDAKKYGLRHSIAPT